MVAVGSIVGAEERPDLIAADIVAHWEKRRESLVGKGMIVVMSRRIAVRPSTRRSPLCALSGNDPDPNKWGDQGRRPVHRRPAEYQPHVYTKDVPERHEAAGQEPDDPLQLVIVRDMWLTGF